MSTAQDQVLAMLLLQHARETLDLPQEERVIARNLHLLPKPEGKADDKVGQRKKRPMVNGRPILPSNHRKGTSLALFIEPPGTLDAKAFIVAMRKAGQRPNDKGVLYTKQDEVRNDQIRAIAAYCGYDSRLPFGQQESLARMKANREISGKAVGGPSRDEQRAVARSLQGFVAGVPDSVGRKLADLRAREQAAVTAMLDHNKAWRDESRDAGDRVISMQLARVEGERLEQIRADIDALT